MKYWLGESWVDRRMKFYGRTGEILLYPLVDREEEEIQWNSLIRKEAKFAKRRNLYVVTVFLPSRQTELINML